MNECTTTILERINECDFQTAANLALREAELLSQVDADSSDALAELSILLYDQHRLHGSKLLELEKKQEELGHVRTSIHAIQSWFFRIFNELLSACVSLPSQQSLFDGSSVSERLHRLQSEDNISYQVDRLTDDLHHLGEIFLILPKWSFHVEYTQIKKGALHVLAKLRMEYLDNQDGRFKELGDCVAKARGLNTQIVQLECTKRRVCDELSAKVRGISQRSSNNRFNPMATLQRGHGLT